MERTIAVSVQNKIATAAKDALYVCGNSDYVIVFDFDDEWSGQEIKTARFAYNGVYQDVVFSGNQCPAPIISDTYSFKVGVYAGNLKTTTPAYVLARKSILCGGGLPDNPPPDVYTQIMELLNGQPNAGGLDEDALFEHLNRWGVINSLTDADGAYLTDADGAVITY